MVVPIIGHQQNVGLNLVPSINQLTGWTLTIWPLACMPLLSGLLPSSDNTLDPPAIIVPSPGGDAVGDVFLAFHAFYCVRANAYLGNFRAVTPGFANVWTL
jgi:hypothetical protein